MINQSTEASEDTQETLNHDVIPPDLISCSSPVKEAPSVTEPQVPC